MKGYTTSVVSFLQAMPLLPNHPALFVAVTVLMTVVILAFWTGAVRLEFTSKK